MRADSDAARAFNLVVSTVATGFFHAPSRGSICDKLISQSPPRIFGLSLDVSLVTVDGLEVATEKKRVTYKSFVVSTFLRTTIPDILTGQRVRTSTVATVL